MTTGTARGALAALLVAGTVSPAVAQDPRFNWSVGENRWMLGVEARNIPNGVQVAAVVPNSAASRAGLSVGDVILSVEGAPVGFVNGRVRDLGDALNQQADNRGRVTIRVRDGRTGRARNESVRLAPAAGNPPILPPPRPPAPPPGGGWGGGWGGGGWGGGWGGGGGWGVNAGLNTINNWYRRYLDRDLNPNERRIFKDMLAQGASLVDIHIGILASTEYFDRAGNRPALFVRSVFEDVVGRTPTRLEQANWTNRLRNVHRNNRVQFASDFLATFYRG